MPLSRRELFERLDALSIETTTVAHMPVFTVEAYERVLGHLPGAHCKSLFLKDKKDALWLVVALNARVLDMTLLARAIGAARLSFGRPELLKEVLGVEPGSVSPLALINDTRRRISVVLDRALADAEVAHFHPLGNDATTAIRPADLRRFIAHCGQRVIEADLGALGGPEAAP
jgi:Ala-tRNA(Pro) deacylase